MRFYFFMIQLKFCTKNAAKRHREKEESEVTNVAAFRKPSCATSSLVSIRSVNAALCLAGEVSACFHRRPRGLT